jgi:hypothetical protein
MYEPTNHAGILTFAFGLEYQKQAYCQALTARATLGLPLSVVVDKLEYAPLGEIADKVIINNLRWARFEYEQMALDLSPYTITYKTDADMLFPAGSMVYHPEHLAFSSGVATDLLGNVSYSTAYRETESKIGLPVVYSALFSFDKSKEETVEFFDRVKYLFRNWYNLRIWEHADRKFPPTTDTVYSIAHLDTVGSARVDGNEFIHAKPYINPWTYEQWTQHKKFTIDNKLRMYLDGARISSPFHYFDKALITENFIKRLHYVCSLQTS